MTARPSPVTARICPYSSALAPTSTPAVGWSRMRTLRPGRERASHQHLLLVAAGEGVHGALRVGRQDAQPLDLLPDERVARARCSTRPRRVRLRPRAVSDTLRGIDDGSDEAVALAVLGQHDARPRRAASAGRSGSMSRPCDADRRPVDRWHRRWPGRAASGPSPRARPYRRSRPARRRARPAVGRARRSRRARGPGSPTRADRSSRALEAGHAERRPSGAARLRQVQVRGRAGWRRRCRRAGRSRGRRR